MFRSNATIEIRRPIGHTSRGSVKYGPPLPLIRAMIKRTQGSVVGQNGVQIPVSAEAFLRSPSLEDIRPLTRIEVTDGRQTGEVWYVIGVSDYVDFRGQVIGSRLSLSPDASR